MSHESTSPTRLQRGALALLGALVLAGCAGAHVKPMEWPPPPDKARIRFIRSFSKEGDISGGAWRAIWRVIVPPSPSTRIKQPIGIALSPDGRRVYVTNGLRGTVVRVDLDTGDFSLAAVDRRRLVDRPMGIAVDGDEALYVSDEITNNVVVYDRSGAFQREFGKDHLDRPGALAIDRKRQLLYVMNGIYRESSGQRIDVFSLKGEHLRTFGKRGAAVGEFNYPSNLSVAPDGRLFVADMLNFRIQIFDPEGNQAGVFGQIGAGEPGTFDKAKGVAVDTFGNIYVTDGNVGQVQIFNPDQRPLMAFGGRGVDPGFLRIPGAIAIDARNHIFVCDTVLASVSEYELFDTTAQDSFLPPPSPEPPAGAPQPPQGQKPQGG